LLVCYYLYYCVRGHVHSRDTNRFSKIYIFIVHILLYLCWFFFSFSVFVLSVFFPFESWEQTTIDLFRQYACARSVFPPQNIGYSDLIVFFLALTIRIFLRPYVHRRVLQGLEKLISILLHFFKFTGITRLWCIDIISS